MLLRSKEPPPPVRGRNEVGERNTPFLSSPIEGEERVKE